MCHDARSAPPRPPSPAGSCLAEPRTLLSRDGTRFAAFLARPIAPGSVGVVVLPDLRGLAPFYTELAQRPAEQGHPAVALDWFGRSAGADLAARGEPFPRPEHVASLSRDTMQDDLVAAADLLRSPDGGACSTVAAVGFCMGGRAAFLAAAPRFGLGGVVGFYGAPGTVEPYGHGPTQEAADLAGPILAIFAGADEGIRPEEVAAFDAALATAGVGHEVVVYPGARHGFFDVTRMSTPPAARTRGRGCCASWAGLLPPTSVPGRTMVRSKQRDRVLIRAAIAGDWPLIYPIFDAVVAEGKTYTYPEGLSSDEAKKAWKVRPPGQTVVAVEDDLVVGTAMMGANRPGRGSHIATASFMVDPATRGRGVGRALGNHMLEWACPASYTSSPVGVFIASRPSWR